MAMPDLVFLGIRGSVVAMDRTSGSRTWETKLKGSDFVTLLVDGSRVLAGTQGEVYCLDAGTGEILWQDGLKGYGYGLMSIATASGTSAPTELAAEHQRRQQTSSSDTTMNNPAITS
jgi:outer membrane protein assembly factor BamB